MTMLSERFPLFTQLDPRARFFLIYAVTVVAGCFLLAGVLGHNVEEARRNRSRSDETARVERIVTQTWWRDENAGLEAEVARIKLRFWSATTIGLVRAELERVLQSKIAASGLKASSLVVESKTTEADGVSLLQAQFKVAGQTQGLLALLEDLGNETRDLFVSGVSMRVLPQQTQAEVIVFVPTLLEQK